MDDRFLRYWYAGFDRALESMDARARELLLENCGRACADSYTRKVYVDEYEKAADMDDFISRLESVFLEVKYAKTDGGYILTYDRCSCDIAGKGFVKSPVFCHCSACNARENWEAVVGQGNADVELIESILGGAQKCAFKIILKR